MSTHERAYEGTPSEPPQSHGALIDLQQEQPERYFAAIDAVRHDTQRRIVFALVDAGTATYNDLTEYADVSERTLRKHAARLAEVELIDRTDGGVATFAFSDRDARALCSHALSVYFNADAGSV